MAQINRFGVLRFVIGAFCFFCVSATAAPPKPTYLFPSGAARASTTVVTANGTFGNWPVRFWTSDPGISLEAHKDKGKFNVTIGEHVAPGVHWLRFFDQEGASSPRPFVVGTLPEVEEVEPNDTPEAAHSISDRITINGRLARNNDVDCFGVELRAGQTLVASVDANAELGAPMDTVLQVCLLTPRRSAVKKDGVDAFVLEQIDDCVGLDPRIAFSVPHNGNYLVRVFSFPKEPNSTIGFAGGDNFVYRLTLTTGPFINVARPSAIQADTPTVVQLSGWNIRDELRHVSVAGAAGNDSCLASHPEMASFARLAVLDHPVLNYDPAISVEPPVLSLPVTISGSLLRPRQRDEFILVAKKGDKIRLQLASRVLGFAAAPTLQILDAAGKSLVETDDGGSRRGRGGGGSRRSRTPEPENGFTAPDDGKFKVIVRDLYGQASERHLYRLTVSKAVPDFDLSIAADSFLIPVGKPLEIPVTIDRQDGFGETIQLSVEGLPSGVTVAPVTSEKDGSTAKSVKLIVTAAGDAMDWQGPIKIVGSTSGERPQKQFAPYKLAEFEVERNDVWLTYVSGK